MDSVKRIRTHPTITAYDSICTLVPEVIGLHPNHIRTNYKERTSMFPPFGNGYRNTLYYRQRFVVVVVVGKQKIKKIFVDETLLKINGQDNWLWMAYDEPNLHVYLLFHISRERTIFVCYQFFRQR